MFGQMHCSNLFYYEIILKFIPISSKYSCKRKVSQEFLIKNHQILILNIIPNMFKNLTTHSITKFCETHIDKVKHKNIMMGQHDVFDDDDTVCKFVAITTIKVLSKQIVLRT